MNCPASRPKRSAQTRRRVMSAFTDLVFAKGFDHVTVREVVASAAVARSTFYEHFSSKEDVLRASMSRVLVAIAQAVREDAADPELVEVLGHLWASRRLTDAIFTGAPRVILAQALSELVEAHLRDINHNKPLALSYRLAAIHLAEGQIGLVENWLRGRAFCEVEHLAQALHASSRASTTAMLAATVRVEERATIA